MSAAATLAFLTELFTLAPEIVDDVEQLVATIKGAAPAAPITPALTAAMAARDAHLKGLAK